MTNSIARDLIQKILELDESCYIKNYKLITDNNGKVELNVELVAKWKQLTYY